jgi:hypothetical protein
MKKWLNHLITVFAVGAAVQVTAQQAIAQTFLEGNRMDPIYPEHTNDVLSRGFYDELGDTPSSWHIFRPLNEYFGFSPFSLTQSGYPEQQAKRDSEKLDILYRDILLQQVANDPVIRTPDLANPFNSTLRSESPANNGSLQILRGADFSYDR